MLSKNCDNLTQEELFESLNHPEVLYVYKPLNFILQKYYKKKDGYKKVLNSLLKIAVPCNIGYEYFEEFLMLSLTSGGYFISLGNMSIRESLTEVLAGIDEGQLYGLYLKYGMHDLPYTNIFIDEVCKLLKIPNNSSKKPKNIYEFYLQLYNRLKKEQNEKVFSYVVKYIAIYEWYSYAEKAYDYALSKITSEDEILSLICSILDMTDFNASDRTMQLLFDRVKSDQNRRELTKYLLNSSYGLDANILYEDSLKQLILSGDPTIRFAWIENIIPNYSNKEFVTQIAVNSKNLEIKYMCVKALKDPQDLFTVYCSVDDLFIKAFALERFLLEK